MNSLSALILSLSAIGGTPQGELLDFTATWCGPCQSVAPTVERLKRKGYPIRKVDVDQYPELAAKYGVQSIPQFVLVINGEMKQRLIGPQSEATLARVMSKIPRSSKQEKTQPKTAETAVARDDRSRLRRSISIPFLGKSEEISADEIETVRGQNEESEPTPTVSTSNERGPVTANPMQATVRLRVNRGGSVNFGTGTIIESRPSHTMIISCGHIFRGSDANTEIEVDYFEGEEPTTWKGKLIDFDDKADVGLLAIKPNRVLPAIKISSTPSSIQRRNLVFSVGCGSGAPPSRWQMFVKSVDQYVGSSIIECTQAPVSGRSGGGLFNRSGELIGICMAADRERNSGLYAGLKEIFKLLDRTSLTSLYRTPASEPQENMIAKVATEPEVKPTENVVPETETKTVVTEVQHTVRHELTSPELDAIASALQMAGSSGVTVCIESEPQSTAGYQVVISNRLELPDRGVTEVALEEASMPSSSGAETASRSANRLEPGQRLQWDNLLETSGNSHTEAVAVQANDAPAWAR